MQKVLICQHGGSGNHGCEALARTVIALVRKSCPDARITLYSYSKAEDNKYLGDLDGVNISGLERLPGRFSVHNALYHAKRLAKRPASKLPLGGEFKRLVDESDLVVAIGGDNYCYNMGRGYWEMDRFIKSRGKRYVLMGCSIEPDDVPRGLGEHLRLFDAISVRESLSMHALEQFGLANIHYAPDSAFLLELEPCKLPEGLEPARAVGINLSPLVLGLEKNRGVTLRAFAHLSRYILDNSDMQILLVPHVVWPGNDDREALAALRGAMGNTRGRVFTLPDSGARQLKWAISQLKIFVGARTHSTIAAYSTAVPTLALGYSVKARGIAVDLLGDEQGFVVPVQSLKSEDEITRSFEHIYKNHAQLRARLEQTLPEYKERARAACELVLGRAREKERRELNALADSVFSLVGKEHCTGCGACAAVCQAKCVEMQTDTEGFAQPRADEQHCTGCGACRRVCPAACASGGNAPLDAFAAAATDPEALQCASSGGVFGLLARKIIAGGGVVFGAAFDNDFELRHVCAGTESELEPLLRSKYLQSTSEKAIGQAVRLASEGRKVLFCGTGCQVNALALSVPDAARENLLLVDVVCHGVPSPDVFKKWKGEIEAQSGSRVVDINFRDKSSGWQSYSVTATLENGRRVSRPVGSDPYMRLFIGNLSLRRSCYACCAKKAALSDLTLGDFWGIRHFAPRFASAGGASLVLTRTERGRDALMAVRDGIRLQQVEMSGPEKYNPCIYESSPRPAARERMFASLGGESLDMLAGLHAPEQRAGLARRILNRIR